MGWHVRLEGMHPSVHLGATCMMNEGTRQTADPQAKSLNRETVRDGCAANPPDPSPIANQEGTMHPRRALGDSRCTKPTLKRRMVVCSHRRHDSQGCFWVRMGHLWSSVHGSAIQAESRRLAAGCEVVKPCRRRLKATGTGVTTAESLQHPAIMPPRRTSVSACFAALINLLVARAALDEGLAHKFRHAFRNALGSWRVSGDGASTSKRHCDLDKLPQCRDVGRSPAGPPHLPATMERGHGVPMLW